MLRKYGLRVWFVACVMAVSILALSSFAFAETQEGSEGTAPEVSEVNSEEKQEATSEKNQDENLEKNPEDNLEKNHEENPEENPEDNTEENPEENLDENLEINPEENPETVPEDVLKETAEDTAQPAATVKSAPLKVLATGRIEQKGSNYFYYDANNVLVTGQWITHNNKRYFANEIGALYRNTYIGFGATYYYMGEDGSLQFGVYEKADGNLGFSNPETGVAKRDSGWIDCDEKRYFAASGNLYRNQYIKFGNTYYYMGEGGDVQTGVFKGNNGIMRYADKSGIVKMDSGWVNDGDKRYFSANGDLYCNQYIKFGTTFYYMGEDCSVQTGVYERAQGGLGYSDENGIAKMDSGWVYHNDNAYFAADGNLYRDQFIKFGNIFYYLGHDGSVRKGLFETVDGKQLYSDPSTGVVQMTAGWIEVEGKRYFAAEGGVIYKDIIISFGPKLYYMGKDGSVQFGWIDYNNERYFAASDGLLYHDQYIKFGTTYYYMGRGGAVQKGFYWTIDGKLKYSDPNSGVARIDSGWLRLDGKDYFVAQGGDLYHDQFIHFGPIYYYMGADGAVLKGRQELDGMIYDFDPTTGAITFGWMQIDGKKCYLQSNGRFAVGDIMIDGLRYHFDENGHLDSMVGIDVSEFNGTIDWKKVKNAGIEFAIVRVGGRFGRSGNLYSDDEFKTNIEGALDAGLKVSVYFFTQAITEAEAIEEARITCEAIKKYNIDLPVVIDTEYLGESRHDYISTELRTAVVKAFCEEVKRQGYTPMIYASTSWLYRQLDMTKLLEYDVWVAEWSNSCSYGGNYTFWQYTSSGSVNGISGRVDMNIWYTVN